MTYGKSIELFLVNGTADSGAFKLERKGNKNSTY